MKKKERKKNFDVHRRSDAPVRHLWTRGDVAFSLLRNVRTKPLEHS